MPGEHKQVKKPCLTFWKSLYGPPESGFVWDQKLCETMNKLGTTHVDNFPSNLWVSKYKLLLSDLVCMLKTSLQVARPATMQSSEKSYNAIRMLKRFFGREHHITRSPNDTTCSFHIKEFCSIRTSGHNFSPTKSASGPRPAATEKAPAKAGCTGTKGLCCQCGCGGANNFFVNASRKTNDKPKST